MKLFDQGNVANADYDVVLPAAIDKATKFFVREMKKLPKTFAMVHSKVALVDPLVIRFADNSCATGAYALQHSAVC